MSAPTALFVALQLQAPRLRVDQPPCSAGSCSRRAIPMCLAAHRVRPRSWLVGLRCGLQSAQSHLCFPTGPSSRAHRQVSLRTCDWGDCLSCLSPIVPECLGDFCGLRSASRIAANTGRESRGEAEHVSFLEALAAWPLLQLEPGIRRYFLLHRPLRHLCPLTEFTFHSGETDGKIRDFATGTRVRLVSFVAP